MARVMVTEMERIEMEGKGIREVETEMREILRVVGATALGKYLEQKDKQFQEQEEVCGCGGQMNYLFKRKATILSVFGRVSYRGSYHSCEQSHAGQSPWDRSIGIEAGKVTAGLAELLALAGVAFEEATRWLERYLLFRVSDNTLRKETEQFGQIQKTHEAEWKQKSQDEKWLQQRQREIGKQAGRLYGSLDGVMAPLIGEWRELKNIAWYRVAPVRSYQKRRHHAKCVGEQNELQAQDITYHCDIQPPNNSATCFGRAPANARQTCTKNWSLSVMERSGSGN